MVGLTRHLQLTENFHKEEFRSPALLKSNSSSISLVEVKGHFLHYTLSPLPLVLSLDTTEKSQVPALRIHIYSYFGNAATFCCCVSSRMCHTEGSINKSCPQPSLQKAEQSQHHGAPYFLFASTSPMVSGGPPLLVGEKHQRKFPVN